MTLYRNLYFAALTGALAGLLSWAVSNLILLAAGIIAGLWVSDTVTLCVLGIFLAVAIYVYTDVTNATRIKGASIGWGVLLGLGSALIAAAIVALIRPTWQEGAPILYRLFAWAIAGSTIGLGIGSRWVRRNRVRMFHAYVGGLAGGLSGAVIFAFLGPHSPELFQASGLMLFGAGTSFGSSLAPLLVREGAVEFISSGDARAQTKLGRSGKRWNLEPGERYVLGNMAISGNGGHSQNGVDLSIPDAFLAPQHAVLYSRDGRYFIARHPDAGESSGVAKYVLRVHGKTVVASQELRNLDELVVGKTSLRFSTRKSQD